MYVINDFYPNFQEKLPTYPLSLFEIDTFLYATVLGVNVLSLI